MKFLFHVLFVMIILIACVTARANDSNLSTEQAISASSNDEAIIEHPKWPSREPTEEELMPPSHEPLDAVAEWMIKQPAMVANSTVIRQERQFGEEQAAVLLTFNPQRWKSPLPALALFDIEQSRNGWITIDHDYNQAPVLINETLTFHNHHSGPNAKWAAVYGLVGNQEVSHVAITWKDGLQETVQLENNSYLSIRTDDPFAQAIQVTALDLNGKALAEYNTRQAPS